MFRLNYSYAAAGRTAAAPRADGALESMAVAFEKRNPPAAPRADFVLQGMTVAVRSDHTLSIDGPAGCAMRVLSGRAWITLEGVMQDVIAEPFETVAVRTGIRHNLSALCDVVTVLITVPPELHDARFVFSTRDGGRQLTITGGRHPLRASLSELLDNLTAFRARRQAPSADHGARPRQ